MTIYVHFNVRAEKQSERLFNVDSVRANGPDSIKVKFQFSDNGKTFTDVSHVAVQPERE